MANVTVTQSPGKAERKIKYILSYFFSIWNLEKIKKRDGWKKDSITIHPKNVMKKKTNTFLF